MRIHSDKLQRFIAAARQGFRFARRQRVTRLAIFRRAFVAAQKGEAA